MAVEIHYTWKQAHPGQGYRVYRLPGEHVWKPWRWSCRGQGCGVKGNYTTGSFASREEAYASLYTHHHRKHLPGAPWRRLSSRPSQLVPDEEE